MSATFVQRGDAIDYTPGTDLVAGDVVAVEDLVSVAKIDAKAGELGALAVTGVFEFPKATGAGNSIAFGKKVASQRAGSPYCCSNQAHRFKGKTNLPIGISFSCTF